MIENIGSGTVPAASQTDALSNQALLGQEEFLNILLTQLTFQDPLKPLDNQEFIAQMAQFTNLEQTRLLNDNSQVLLTVQSATQAIGLIGKTVTINSANGGADQEGSVSRISFNQGIPQMTLLLTNGSILENVSLADVQTIRN